MIQHLHRKIRVTSVLPSFAGGGAERVVLTMLRYLDRTHYAPSLVVLSGEGPLREAVPNDLPVTDLARPRLRYAWFRLGQAVRATNPDIVLPTISHINLATLMQRGKLASHTRIIARNRTRRPPAWGRPAGRAYITGFTDTIADGRTPFFVLHGWFRTNLSQPSELRRTACLCCRTPLMWRRFASRRSPLKESPVQACASWQRAD